MAENKNLKSINMNRIFIKGIESSLKPINRRYDMILFSVLPSRSPFTLLICYFSSIQLVPVENCPQLSFLERMLTPPPMTLSQNHQLWWLPPFTSRDMSLLYDQLVKWVSFSGSFGVLAMKKQLSLRIRVPFLNYISCLGKGFVMGWTVSSSKKMFHNMTLIWK